MEACCNWNRNSGSRFLFENVQIIPHSSHPLRHCVEPLQDADKSVAFVAQKTANAFTAALATWAANVIMVNRETPLNWNAATGSALSFLFLKFLVIPFRINFEAVAEP